MSEANPFGPDALVHWDSKANERHLVELTLLSMWIGLWLWEYASTVSFDITLVTGKRPLQLRGVIYLCTRLSLHAFVIGAMVTNQNYQRVDCEAAWKATNAFAVVAVMGARSVFVLRAVAAWNYSSKVVIPISIFWLTVLALSVIPVQLDIQIAQHSDLLGWKCMPITAMNKTLFLWQLFLSIAFDVTTATLTLWKLYKISKASHVRLLHLVVRDACIFGTLTLTPTIGLIVTFLLHDFSVLLELIALDIVSHVILASRAYAAIFESALTMLPHEERILRKVINGDMLDPQSLKRLTFKMSEQTGSKDPRRRTGGHEDRYLPGAMSRETHDPTPPFASYFIQSPAMVLAHDDEDPDSKPWRHNHQTQFRHSDGGIEFPMQALGGKGEDVVDEVIQHAQTYHTSTTTSHSSDLMHAHSRLGDTAANIGCRLPLPRISLPPSTVPSTFSMRSKLFGKRLRGARSASHLDGSSGSNGNESGGDLRAPHADRMAPRHSAVSSMDVRVGVDVDVRVEYKEAYPLPAIFQRLQQGESSGRNRVDSGHSAKDVADGAKSVCGSSVKTKGKGKGMSRASFWRSPRGSAEPEPEDRNSVASEDAPAPGPDDDPESTRRCLQLSTADEESPKRKRAPDSINLSQSSYGNSSRRMSSFLRQLSKHNTPLSPVGSCAASDGHENRVLFGMVHLPLSSSPGHPAACSTPTPLPSPTSPKSSPDMTRTPNSGSPLTHTRADTSYDRDDEEELVGDDHNDTDDIAYSAENDQGEWKTKTITDQDEFTQFRPRMMFNSTALRMGATGRGNGRGRHGRMDSRYSRYSQNFLQQGDGTGEEHDGGEGQEEQELLDSDSFTTARSQPLDMMTGLSFGVGRMSVTSTVSNGVQGRGTSRQHGS
ncbi:hypothetical protein CF319_g1735 [Tilletia indica]|nr:hypothetical protein CF319_g1735 [Tilletia indica]